MQDIQNILDVKSIRWRKVEKRTLERLGHVLRMDGQRPTKIAVLGWLTELEKLPKTRGSKRKKLLFWQKLLKEAGVNWQKAAHQAQDRKKWKMIKERMTHLPKYKKRAHFHSHNPPLRETRFLPQFHSRCRRELKTESALRNHEKSCLSTIPTGGIEKR